MPMWTATSAITPRGCCPSARAIRAMCRWMDRRAHGEIQAVQRVVETHPAFVESPVEFEHVSLARLSPAEGPCQRHRERLTVPRHGHQAALCLAHDAPLEAAVLKNKRR